MVEPNVPTASGATDIVTATYQYDDLNRLTSLIDTTASLTTLYSFTYTYRADGLRTSSTEQVNGSTNTTSWTYDNLDRLTAETYSSTGSPSTNYSATYTYDNVGNRLTEVLINGSNTTSTTDTYDARDRLTGATVTTNGSPTSATTDTYDSNGSLVQSQTTIGTQTTTNTYSYDARGRLLTAQVNGSSAKQEVG